LNPENDCIVNPNVNRNLNSVPYLNNIIKNSLKKRSDLIYKYAENNRNLGQTFHDIGEQFAVFLQRKGTFPTDTDILSVVGSFIYHQAVSHALNEKLENLDDQIVTNMIIRDRNIYSEGFEQQIAHLHEMLANGEMGAPEYVEKLSFWHRWFENYPMIEEYRKQKLQNLITWEKMVTQIEQLLQLPFYEVGNN